MGQNSSTLGIIKNEFIMDNYISNGLTGTLTLYGNIHREASDSPDVPLSPTAFTMELSSSNCINDKACAKKANLSMVTRFFYRKIKEEDKNALSYPFVEVLLPDGNIVFINLDKTAGINKDLASLALRTVKEGDIIAPVAILNYTGLDPSGLFNFSLFKGGGQRERKEKKEDQSGGWFNPYIGSYSKN